MRERIRRVDEAGENLLSILVADGGATLVEYGFVVLLIAVASIAALTALGPKVASLFSPVAPAL